MIVGDPKIFAIESEITEAYAQLGFRALGYFVIHLHGFRYGVYEHDATFLACSLDEVERRIANRGTHAIPMIQDSDARQIADAYWNVIYGEGPRAIYFGVPSVEFNDLVVSSRIDWAPDGDAAFDDGGYVLQFDIAETVRLIGFRSIVGGVDASTLTDVQLSADQFYGVLSEWRDAFLAAWEFAPKCEVKNRTALEVKDRASLE